jgi:glycerophosphoryl diester phosphodiesterase
LPTPLGRYWRRGAERPLVLGHRGARHARPENTLAAFDLALDEGADGVELDVRLNADGEAVVCHDENLSRVTAGRDGRRIRDLSSEACRHVDLGGGEALPTLARVLAWAEGRQALVNVEIKTRGGLGVGACRVVAELCRKAPDPDRLLVSSFGAACVLLQARTAPELASAWLFATQTSAWLSTRRALVAAAVHPSEALVTPRRMRAWHALGLRVHVWTVNDPKRALALSALGVDCLISDHPAAVLGRLAAG